MKTLERHQSDVRWAEIQAKEQQKRLNYSFEAIRRVTKLTTLNAIQKEARSLAAFQSVLDPNDSDILSNLEYAARALAGLYRCAETREGTVSVELGDGGPPVEFEATGINALTYTGTWRIGYYLAAILRDRELMDLLSKFSSDDLRQAPGVSAEPFLHPLVDALRGYWINDPNTAVYLTEAMELTDPEKLQIADVDYVLDVAVPMMEVFFRLLENDEKAFNEALVKALKLHKAYWGSETADRADDIEGILSLELCSLAALACEQDIEIEVESDYIPSWLVRGEAPEQG